jgi:riboflavin synthase
MFTGLIQKIGTLRGIARRGEGARLTVCHNAWEEPLLEGESVAVNGVCLTVTGMTARSFECDVLRETLDRTNLATKKRGAPLNLERALRPTDRMGGHFVTGHIDGPGSVAAFRKSSDDWILEIACAPDIIEFVSRKGSVACDGVSLTVTDVSTSAFQVNLIPFTRSNTALNAVRTGDTVNIETDILAKYVRSRGDRGRQGAITLERLGECGFL